MKIILASASPRRKELLGHIFDDFSIIPSDSEEDAAASDPGELVCMLARQKAGDITKSKLGVTGKAAGSYDFDQAALVVGADTIVYSDGHVLGKPKDKKDAFRMLRSLSGKTHEVYTGICVMILQGGLLCLEKSFFERTFVTFDELTDQEINAYIDSGEPMDKAGSYGIQGLFSKHIRSIEGDYFNVVGLPVNRLYRELITIDKRFASE